MRDGLWCMGLILTLRRCPTPLVDGANNCLAAGKDRRSLNGYVAEEEGLLSLAHAAEWLRSKAIELYPNSEFAKAHGARNRES